MVFDGVVATAGEVLAVRCEPTWAADLVTRAVGGPLAPTGTAEPTVALDVQSSRLPFDTADLRPVTRGVYATGRRAVLVNACGSGFDLQVLATDRLEVAARYRPSTALRAANRVLAARFALLAGQTLVHYPVLWRAGWRGRVPLHVSVLATAAGVPLLAGPGGVGKSTVLSRAVAAGAAATADNICCTDGATCFGLAEPLRVDSGVAAVTAGRRPARTSVAPGTGRTTHGRTETAFAGRVAALDPDRVVILERAPVSSTASAEPDDATRTLVAGTYAAGELRRYWAFAAVLALATGRGPAHPPITEVAAGLAARLPCYRVQVGDGEEVDAMALCGGTR